MATEDKKDKLKFCIDWIFERVIEYLDYNNVKIIIAKKGEVFFDEEKDKKIDLNGMNAGTENGDTVIFISSPKRKNFEPAIILLEEIFHDFFVNVNHRELNRFLKFLFENLSKKQKNILASYIHAKYTK